jgi:hypothetical protein
VTLFDLPNGYRLTLVSRQVGVAPEGTTLFLDRVMRVVATATDEVREINGEWRRRFAHAEPPLVDYCDDVWVSDDAVYDYSPADALMAMSR